MNKAEHVWTVEAKDFPKTGSMADKLAFAVRYAILSPSSHNTQPWRFRICDDRLDLIADRTHALVVIDPDGRQLAMSCGAALFTLRLALRALGQKEKTNILPEGSESNVIATVRIVGEGEPRAADKSLFAAILTRRTNRLPFENKPVDVALLARLEEAAVAEGAWFAAFADQKDREALAEIIAKADAVQGKDRRFRRELDAWVRQNRPEGTERTDGMPGYGVTFADLMAGAQPLVLRTFEWGDGQAAKDRQLAEESNVLAVLGMDGEDLEHWVRGGQALAHVLLVAESAGLAVSYLNQPVEVRSMWPELMNGIGRDGMPHHILRIGYGTSVPPTTRRSSDQVIENNL
ncbi:MAG: hypothetical protein U9N14_03205 [Pseudomonadota bacterium]|nr:hypothetical protein [Pseudomonadota bacterium]